MITKVLMHLQVFLINVLLDLSFAHSRMDGWSFAGKYLTTHKLIINVSPSF